MCRLRGTLLIAAVAASIYQLDSKTSKTGFIQHLCNYRNQWRDAGVNKLDALYGKSSVSNSRMIYVIFNVGIPFFPRIGILSSVGDHSRGRMHHNSFSESCAKSIQKFAGNQCVYGTKRPESIKNNVQCVDTRPKQNQTKKENRITKKQINLRRKCLLFQRLRLIVLCTFDICLFFRGFRDS